MRGIIDSLLGVLLGIYKMRQASLLWILAIASEKKISLVTAIDALADEATGRYGTVEAQPDTMRRSTRNSK